MNLHAVRAIYLFEIARTGRTRAPQVPSVGCSIKYARA